MDLRGFHNGKQDSIDMSYFFGAVLVAQATILDETIQGMVEQASFQGSIGKAHTDISTVLACHSLELRLKKLKQYDNYFKALSEESVDRSKKKFSSKVK